jgi:hypothetical protein
MMNLSLFSQYDYFAAVRQKYSFCRCDDDSGDDDDDDSGELAA